MIKIQIIGHLAHDNKLFDVQCTKCGMMYDNKTLNGSPGCLKCNSPLDSIRTKENRPMAISEGTIYPTLTEADKNQDAENVARRKNALPITHRFVLFSFADKETGILQEPPVHQYLAKGREVMLEVGHNPIASWYRAKDKSIKLELRYTMMYNKGDKIQLLGRKETAASVAQPIQANVGVGTVNNTTGATMSPDVATKVAGLQAQLNALVAGQKNTNAVPGEEVALEVAAQQSLFPTEEDPFA